MSGHSKWAKIKRQKGVSDQKRGLEFSKISRMITIAVKHGGSGDPANNASLRLAVEKARQVNMPKDNVKRAIDRGLGSGDAGSLEEVTYEGYGPMGVAFMVRCSSDNRQRTTAVIKNVFERSGGSLGAPGSAAFMFDRIGHEIVAKTRIPVSGGEAEKIRRLVDDLEELEDVEAVANTAALS